MKRISKENLNSYKPSFTIGFAAFVVDGLVLGFIATSGILLIINFAFKSPYNLYKSVLRKKLQTEALMRSLIIILFAIATISYCIWLDKTAVKRANVVLSALEKYKQINGKFPTTLEELVPKYLMENPRLKPTFFTTKLKYHNSNGRLLLYFGPSPGPSPTSKTFNFDKNEWEIHD